MGRLFHYANCLPLPPDQPILIDGDGQRYVDRPSRNGVTVICPVYVGRDGGLRMRIISQYWAARYRDERGRLIKRSTKCKDRVAALAILEHWEVRAERVRAGIVGADTPDEIDTNTKQFLNSLRAGDRSEAYLTELEAKIRRVCCDCKFTSLVGIRVDALEVWLITQKAAGMAAATRNKYRGAILGLVGWAVDRGLMTTNVLRTVKRASQRSDRRLERRALTDDDISRLLYVARWRPLAEYGRDKIKIPPEERPESTRDSPKNWRTHSPRATWKRAPLEYERMMDAVGVARVSLRHSPEFITELDRKGRERALVYRLILCTGMRRNEVRRLTVAALHLDGDAPYVQVSPKIEKNRKGAKVPLRQDLVAHLRAWLDEMATGYDKPLPPDTTVFRLPTQERRFLYADMAVAGIPRYDGEGRSIDLHAMRVTFGTKLARAGVAPRVAQAAMRHSRLELTMSVYVDETQLDVGRAVESLPAITPADEPPQEDNKAAELIELLDTLSPTQRQAISDALMKHDDESDMEAEKKCHH